VFWGEGASHQSARQRVQAAKARLASRLKTLILSMGDATPSRHDSPFSPDSEAAPSAAKSAGALGEVRPEEDMNEDASVKQEWRDEIPGVKHEDATKNALELEHEQRVRRYADLLVEATRRHTLLPSDMLGKKFRWAAASAAVQTDARPSFSCFLLLGLAALSSTTAGFVRPHHVNGPHNRGEGVFLTR
jgi:hypothetical protein